MGVSYHEIRNERQLKASTGLSKKEFKELCSKFERTFEWHYEKGLSEYSAGLKEKILLDSYEDILFFVLFQLKNGMTNDCLGLIFGMDTSTAQRNFRKYLKLLSMALHQEGVMPKRSIESVEELKSCLGEEKEIIIDGNESPTQRPKDDEEQKEWFSGKKKDTLIKRF